MRNILVEQIHFMHQSLTFFFFLLFTNYKGCSVQGITHRVQQKPETQHMYDTTPVIHAAMPPFTASWLVQ